MDTIYLDRNAIVLNRVGANCAGCQKSVNPALDACPFCGTVWLVMGIAYDPAESLSEVAKALEASFPSKHFVGIVDEIRLGPKHYVLQRMYTRPGEISATG